jgi:hypothetical protein
MGKRAVFRKMREIGRARRGRVLTAPERRVEHHHAGFDRARIEQRFDQLLGRIEAEPKSRGWRRRAKVGDKKVWYELPEEVE